MKLLHGRPKDETGRLPKEIRVYDLLDSLGIEFDRIDHPAANTMEDCIKVDSMLGGMICKNLFLCNRQKTDFYLLMIPGNKTLHTKDLSGQIQTARLSFAPAEAMEEYLDITPGSVSVMGLMNDRNNRVRLLIDREVAESELVGCHPCINTVSMRMHTKDLLEKFLPAVHHTATFVDLPND